MKFELSEDQVAKAFDWMNSKPKKPEGAIGGRFTFTFTPTSLGIIEKVCDSLDPENPFLDLTYYDMW